MIIVTMISTLLPGLYSVCIQQECWK